MTDRTEELKCVIHDLCHQVRERDAEIARLRVKLNESLACIALLEHDAKTREYETLYAQTVCELQASQAREARLREFLTPEQILFGDVPPRGDDTALKARLKAERERCAVAAESMDLDANKHDIATAIRNLGDEQ